MEDGDKIVKKYRCTVDGCEARFPRPSKLEVHLRKHTGERPFKCLDCDKTYTNETHLRRHKKTTHLKSTSDILKCPHEGCYRELSNKYSYKKHLDRCHNIKRKFNYPCDKCEKGFFKKNQLNTHMYEHTGIPPYTCEICQIGFTSKTLFSKHNSQHKTYECKCNATFARWSALLKHKKTCDACVAASFECDICEKRFNNRRKLKVHTDRHENDEKPFACPVNNCTRRYKYKSNLTYHYKHYHLKIEKKRLKCQHPGCKITVTRKQSLIEHMKLHARIRTKQMRQKRKDAGSIKRSTAARLSGFQVPYKVEQMLINGEKLELTEDSVENAELIKNGNVIVEILSDTESEDSHLDIENMEVVIDNSENLEQSNVIQKSNSESSEELLNDSSNSNDITAEDIVHNGVFKIIHPLPDANINVLVDLNVFEQSKLKENVEIIPSIC